MISLRGSFLGRTVLVTGGTKGIGLSTALAFGRAGARCVVTSKWASVDRDQLLQTFEKEDAGVPFVEVADVGYEDDTTDLLDRLQSNGIDDIDIFVSNVSFAEVVSGVDEYTKRGLLRSIEHSAWPIIGYTEAIRATFGRYPRYVIGVSSWGPDLYLPHYDIAAAAKSVPETLVRYAAVHWASHGVRTNIVRSGLVYTESLKLTLGEDRVGKILAEAPDVFITPEEVANVMLALSSGSLDALNGQVIMADKGKLFSRNLVSLLLQKEGKTEVEI